MLFIVTIPALATKVFKLSPLDEESINFIAKAIRNVISQRKEGKMQPRNDAVDIIIEAMKKNDNLIENDEEQDSNKDQFEKDADRPLTGDRFNFGNNTVDYLS